jgi:signal transduction histidine kinase/ActR/RegA family two-component response regulator
MVAGTLENGGPEPMQPEDFRPDDLFAQIQGLVEAVDAERQLRERAEAADRAKSELLAVVSHELRTPMGAVISMSELLLNSPLDTTQRRYAETLQQSARSLLTVLNDILDYSKLEAGRFELDRAAFDLHELVKSVGSEVQARAREKGLKGVVNVGMSCPRFVKGDATRLRQVLTNLTDNAVKFTSTGAVHLHANSGEASGRLALRFDVTDTGIGFSEFQKERLFQPYVQADRTKANEYGGTGLGLSIARRLVELMGGEIGCESAVGQGSLFWFTIPTERAETTPFKDAPGTGTLTGHVLVVEDNAVNRMLIGAYLEEFGLTYDVVENGGEALVRLAAKDYDLVLMDIMMPELDGVETTKRIRKLGGDTAEVPIVALTAHAMKGDREDYLAAGMDGYVSKPIRGRDLFAALVPYLSDDDDEYADAVVDKPFVAAR